MSSLIAPGLDQVDEDRILKHLQDDDAPALAAHLRALAKAVPALRIGGEDLLTRAIRRNARHCVEALAQLGLGLNRLSVGEAKHPLEEAMDANAHLVLATLLQHGANPNSRHTQHGTVMRAAAMTRTVDSLIPLLCTKGGDPDSPDPRDDSTPLHAAVAKEQALNVGQLLEYGASVNAPDIMGRTPLHLAMLLADCTPISTLLLDHGADPHAPDVGGLSPAALAGIRDEPALVKLLLDRVDWAAQLAPPPPVAFPALASDEFRRRLLEAVRRGNRRSLMELLEQGGRNWHPVETVKESPLLQALSMRRLDLAAPLLARELGLEDVDFHRRNAVFYLLFASQDLEALAPFAQAIRRAAPELFRAQDKSGCAPLDAAITGGAPIVRSSAEKLFSPR